MGSLWTIFWKNSSIVNTRVKSRNLNEDSVSCGDRRAVGSQFQVLGPYAAKLRCSRRPSPGHQEGSKDCRARLSTTVCRRHRHTEVGQVTWHCVVQTFAYQHRRVKDHSLTNWKPMKCCEDRCDERRRPDKLPHSVPTGGGRDGRRQYQQEVSSSSSS